MYNNNNGASIDSKLSLGYLIRQRRKEEKLSMQTVASKAGLSVGFISQVERNITIPSLASLRAIAEVLKQRVSFFIDHSSGDVEIAHFRTGLYDHESEDGVVYEKLSTQFPGSIIQSLIFYQPGGFRSDSINLEGEVLIFILDGELTIEFEDKQVVLKKGDSIHFDSMKTHTVWNHTSKLAVSFWCGTMEFFNNDSLE